MTHAVATLAERAGHLHAAGLAASDDGRPALAVRRLRAGLRLTLADRADPDPALVEVRARLLVSLAWAESERGRVDLGFRVLDQADPLMPPSLRPVLLAQRALLLKRSGRNDAALREFDRAIALLERWADPLDLVKALNNRSLVHLEAGHVRAARADLQRGAGIAEEHGLAVPAALTMVNLGCLDVISGDLPSALRAFAAARVRYQALAPGRLANLAVERARALVAAGLFLEADRELAAAIDQASHQRLSHTYADALQVRAEAALLAGRSQAAAHWARQAQDRFLARRNSRRAALASLLDLRARQATATPERQNAIVARARALAVRLGRLGLREDARAAALVAARALAATGRPRLGERMTTRYGPPGRIDRLDTRLLWRLARAEIAEAANRPTEASRQLVAGMATLHRYRSRFGCLDLQTGAAVHGRDLARAGLAAALAGGSPAAVYRWSERARAQALLLPPLRPPSDPTAAAALGDLRQARHTLRTAELAGRPTRDLRTRIETLQRTVREHSWARPGQRHAAGATPAPFTAVRQDLGEAALVIYLRDGPTLRALVVAGGSADLVTVAGYVTAEEAVLRLRADLDARAGRAMPGRLAKALAEATRHDAGRLAGTVLAPVLGLIGDRDLVVVPTGVLMTVPWSALPGCAGRPVTVAPSATVWHAARRRLSAGGRAGASGYHTPCLLVSGPGIRRGEAEVRAIAALHPRATVLTGAGATPATALAALEQVELAHVAAHGRHHTENPLFSTLELADGALLGYDLQHLARAPATVVLSSCELGLADVRPGDEALGMVAVLLGTGSATIIASVAKVADDAAMAVMVAYHRSVAGGRPPASALARALSADPSAGFVCFGAG